MAFEFSSLEPLIYKILSAPGTDLATISAKRVRKQLAELQPSLTTEFLKEHKDEVDVIIATVFERVQNEGKGAGGASDDSASSSSTKKRKHTDDEDEEAKPPLPKKSKESGKNGRGSDADLARQLSSELNGNTRRSGGRAKGTANGKRGSKSRRSAATVDSGEDSDGEEKPKKRGGGGGFGTKEYTLSEPLAQVLQVEKLSRPQVVKQLWAYIKGRELQNPSNKREIICDDSLRAVFNTDKIDMFTMNKVLGKHLHDE